MPGRGGRGRGGRGSPSGPGSPPPNIGSSPVIGSPRATAPVSPRPPNSPRVQPQFQSFPAALGYDPAKPVKKECMITNTRMEVPPKAWAIENDFPSDLPMRPGLNTAGRAIEIRVNQFKVMKWPQRDIYQYDILIGTGAEKRGKVMAVWKSKTVQNALKRWTKDMPWLWDGNKIAWTSSPVDEFRVNVNLDEEKGRAPRPGYEPDVVRVIIRPSKKIRMAIIDAYLQKKIPWDNGILEAINFLDHAMRMWPSDNYTSIKRSFFARGEKRFALDNVIEAMRGVYSSIRLCNPESSIGDPCTGLALNVDVANGTFWTPQDVHQAARNLCKDRNRNLDFNVFRRLLLPAKMKDGRYTMSEDFKNLRKMHKLKFYVKHRGKENDTKEYVIKSFTFNKHPDFAQTGVHAKNHYFKYRSGPGSPEVDTSVFDYFRQRYNLHLNYWELPLIESSRGGFFPMECCVLVANQKYQFKLSPEQTASMIKFAVTRPKDRIAAINHGVNMLKWHKDPYLQHYGVAIDPNMTFTKARLLQPPEVVFNTSKASPGTSGRWDLRGKKFVKPNVEPLTSWAVCIVEGCVDVPTVRNFVTVLVNNYILHGGRVQNKNPVIYEQQRTENLGEAVASCRNAAGNQSKVEPQILLFVLPGRDSFMYERLKKNNECRFAMVSQMLNVAHVRKASPQYCSNVCMKLNAKLGGTTSKVTPPKPFFSRPTMVIGADVSHATPGSPQASMAAITVSMDKEACRYAAAVQTNGYRVEMITEENMKSMLTPLFKHWMETVGGKQKPKHIYYFRDGVSEGQYSHVLQQELEHMKRTLRTILGKEADEIQWTVTICTKRHHIRFFPKERDSSAADNNNNSLPGTLVEKDVTHPFEYDFYLCAHSAIQGTARPVHYHVLLDEAKVPPNLFHQMIYQMSYQYMRSTTPVSLFPAIYYAHLASNRARAHENAPSSEGPRGGQKFEEALQDRGGRSVGGTSHSGSNQLTVAKPLLTLGDPTSTSPAVARIRNGMWYI